MVKRIFFRLTITVVLFVFLTPSISLSAQDRRIALVIGNGAYKSSSLRNPVNDATDIANTLRKLGFSVILKINANQRTMEESIRDFGKKLRLGGVGLFYFAGHGLQVKGRNYLIPIAAEIYEETDIKYEAVDAGRALDVMDNAGNMLNIVILDACRDNPFARSFRSSTSGLARMDAPKGTLIAYSTSPGKVALDGSRRNSPYTEALLKNIQVPALTVEQVFKKTRKDIDIFTGGKQTPWESTSLIGDFYFNPERGITVAQRQTEKTRYSVEVEKERKRLEKEKKLTMIKKQPSIYPDSFYFEPSDWKVNKWGSGGKALALELGIVLETSGTTNDAVSFDSRFQLKGDFEAQVDYEIIEWPGDKDYGFDGLQFGLQIGLGGADPRCLINVYRQGSRNFYATSMLKNGKWSGPDQGYKTNDRPGKFKILRKSGRIRTYYWRKGKWKLAYKFWGKSKSSFPIHIYLDNFWPGHKQKPVRTEVIFKNFVKRIESASKDERILIPTAQVLIDGDPQDWSNITNQWKDPQGDTSTPSYLGTDLSTLFIATNQNKDTLFFLLEMVGTPNTDKTPANKPLVQYCIAFDDPNISSSGSWAYDWQIGIDSDNNFWIWDLRGTKDYNDPSNCTYYSSAINNLTSFGQGSIVEFSMPISLLNSPTKFDVHPYLVLRNGNNSNADHFYQDAFLKF